MIVKEEAQAKLNLTLDVVGLLPNGYHEMLMVMQSISLCDEVTISTKPGDGKINVSTNRSYLPNNEKNLAYIAAKKYMERAEVTDMDVIISLYKRIPVCAGMGGGSSDAAAVLRAMNRLCGDALTVDELCELGADIGSDVPFCVRGGTVLAKGSGTEMEELTPMMDCGIVVLKPRFSVSTPKLFAELDRVKICARPDTEGVLRSLESGCLRELARRCFNIFETVLPQREADVVAGVKDDLISAGAIGACMTGTGSAVFGLFPTVEEAERAYGSLCKRYKECFLAVPTRAI